MRADSRLTIYRSLAEVPASVKPAVVTVGVFDGVHVGHQALMRRVVERAADRGATPVVVTFDRHPLEVIAPGKQPPLIMSLTQRARAMGEIGIRALVVLTFDDALRHLSADAFVREVLVDGLGCIHAVVGANFRFGHEQGGTIETLNDLGAVYGFDITIFALVDKGQTVSSSMIRRSIAGGDVGNAADELGRSFRLEGVVEHGAARGRDLGFPTANLAVDPRMILPKLGVYAGWLWWKGARYPAVTNVGVNPTFGDRATPIVETHVLDFDADLYGETVEVEFIHHLRDEQNFPSVEALITQMHADVENTRSLIAKHAQ